MTTREVFFKGLYYSLKPHGVFRYFHKDKRGKIKLDKYIIVGFNRDEKAVSQSIERMTEREKTEGFICWAISPEGEKLLEDHWEEFNWLANQKTT
jgi:hypothetical protein